MIDPYRNTAPARDLSVDGILLTHEHYDHISGVNKWREATRGQVACSAACAQRISDCRRNCARYFEAFMEMQSWVEDPGTAKIDIAYTCRADRILDHGEELWWQGHCIRCIALPGHSLGSMGYLVDEKHFFPVTVLFPAVCRSCDSPAEIKLPGGKQPGRDCWSCPEGSRFGRAIFKKRIQNYGGVCYVRNLE